MVTKIIKFSFVLIFLAACSREKFADMNTDPDLITSANVDAKVLFPMAPITMHTNDFEAFYDNNRNIAFWTGTWVRLAGMGVSLPSFTSPVTATNIPYRYETFYTRETMGVGGTLVEMRNIIDKMDDAKKARYAHIRAISYIPLAYCAFYVSDIMGSIAFTDAFKARYANPPQFKPTYDTQEQLFKTLDSELKASVAILKETPVAVQEKLGTYDLYFHGTGTEATNWAMAANALRLKMAMRIMKRKPAEAKVIIDEVLADNIGPINSRSASWVFKGSNSVANGGNWNTFGSLSGQKNVIDFMYTNKDPRIRNMYQKTAFTLAQFTTAQAAGHIPATETYQEYRGRYISPDAVLENDKKFYFNTVPGTSTMYTSQIQYGLFNAATATGGMVNFPVITYADVCFMRAELAARGITTELAADWYYKGIEASIADYDEWGKDAKVVGYTAMTAAEVAAYKAMPQIVYDPAKGVEQICVQQYINFYKNFNENWALIKRTGYPSTTGVVMPAEAMKNAGVPVVMPRRWSLFMPPLSDQNYDNRKASLEEMQKDPELKDLSDITGRVWWDKQ